MRKYGLILILFLLSGCFENESVELIKGESMGTSYSINVLGDERIEQDIIDRQRTNRKIRGPYSHNIIRHI